jgi:hypothetical protein
MFDIIKKSVILNKMKDKPKSQKIWAFFDGDKNAITEEQKCEIATIVRKELDEIVNYLNDQI